MGLPFNPRPAETVPIGEVGIELRGLHLFQVRALAEMDRDASDAQAIAWAAGCTPEEATEWIERSSGGDAAQLLAAIMRLSGWTPEAGARFPE